MIISDRQAQLAFLCLNTRAGGEGGDVADVRVCSKVPEDLLARVHEVLSEVPETRADRVEQAKNDLAGGLCTSDDVAHKIIARLISDSLR